ncbi:arginase [Clostridium ihumii]|uniref:arginase n=1 Tax=Clostridium ihumii TaxID=1470356 RepID=UPI00058C2B67|nr:arginase [Clostridium ihumii]
MQINVIGVPLFLGCDKKGVDLSPNQLREQGMLDILRKNNHTVFDLGNLYVPSISECDKFSSHPKMKYLNTIVEVNSNLAQTVYSSLNSNSFPLVIGGDHSLGLGSICGASKYYENLGVIWIDAHGDINTPETSPTGNVHGMPLGAAMGFGDKTLTNLYFNGSKVNPKNVFIIGARDLDKGELELISKEGINVYSTKDVESKGILSILEDINNILNKNNVENIHLSFDIDSIDPEFASGTGTPVPDGMTVDDVKTLLSNLLKTGKIKSMDFVELNTKLEDGTITINLCLDLLDVISESL